MNRAVPSRGQRTTISQWIHSDTCAVRVDVEAVILDEDPSEPCLEPETLRYLDGLQGLADKGDFTELAKHGAVYMRRSA